MRSSIQNICLISNLNLDEKKGGWDGFGANVYNVLQLHFKRLRKHDRINPPIRIIDRLTSKIFRILGIPSQFTVFANKRLNVVNEVLLGFDLDKFEYIIFHGATPWINYQPSRPYAVMLDCTFEQYINIYHDRSKFSSTHISEIIKKEKLFLGKAETVFFTSKWALEDCRINYGLTNRLKFFGLGPSFEIKPYRKKYSVQNQFLFISNDFTGKGGNQVYNAFYKFNLTHVDYQLIIVGDKPPPRVLKNQHVKYFGFIDKKAKDGINHFIDLYTNSVALLSYSRQDITPLVIIEAGYYGCPSIARSITAIPEMLKKDFGFLVENDNELLDEMIKVVNLPKIDYLQLRSSISDHFTTHYNWESTCEKIIAEIW